MSQRVAVVTGANKGIGFAIVKGLCERFEGVVYLTARDEQRGRAAVTALNRVGLFPRFHQLEVTSRGSVAALADTLRSEHGGFDLLVNNAGVAYPSDDPDLNQYVIDVNYRSQLTIQELLFPLLRENCRVLNISSDCGHLSNVRDPYWIDRLSRRDLTVKDINEFVDWFLEGSRRGTFDRSTLADGGTYAAYRVSKVAVSALTRLQNATLEAKHGLAVSMHPGLVQTDMTQGAGWSSADQAAYTPLQLLLEPAPPGLAGGYVWHDGTLLDWSDHRADYFFKSATLKEFKPK